MNQIDFDAAAIAWNANKIRHGAVWKYRCQATVKSTGQPCQKGATPNVMAPLHLCWQHRHYSLRHAVVDNDNSLSSLRHAVVDNDNSLSSLRHAVVDNDVSLSSNTSQSSQSANSSDSA